MTAALRLATDTLPEPLANVEAEAAFLGAILRENDALRSLELAPVPADFAEPVHARIYRLAGDMIADGKAANPPILRPYFENDEALRELGGVAYLTRLTADGSGLLCFKGLAAQIIELAERRRLVAALRALIDECQDFNRPIEAIALPDPAGRASSSAILPFEWAGDVEPVLDEFWLVEGLLPRNGPATLVGKPGAAKTFLAASLAAHVASGADWAGRRVTSGFVLYVVAEGQTGFRNRLAALRAQGQLASSAPFAIIPAVIDLQAPAGDVLKLIRTIKALSARRDVTPALIVIDTLSKTFGAGQENTDDMAAYVANCERISLAFNCLTLIVHHPGKSGDARGERGHSSLRGGVVTSIHVEARDDGLRIATVVKQKDGEEGLAIPFRLQPVTVGTGANGQDVATCIVEFTDDDAGSGTNASRKVRHLTGNKRIGFDLIQTELSLHGQYPPNEIPGDVIDRFKVTRVIGAGQVADKLKSAFWATSSGAPDKRADTAARTARRVISDLKAAQILETWEDWLWFA